MSSVLNKRLLCLAPQRACGPLALPGWELIWAPSLAAAASLLRTQVCSLGLVLDCTAPAWAAQLDSFLQQHWQTLWVGILPPQALAEPRWRRLAAEHLWDYHTSPIDMLRLSHSLGHALGCAGLRRPHCAPDGVHSMAGRSAAMQALRVHIGKLAKVDAPVLIGGESGSGKELAAQAIHAQSARAAAPFVPINCGAIPANLIQSELFGHARGAFTGAAHDKAGLIESAQGGTVLLDEIGDLPREQQATLLRFLQEKVIYRVGATRATAVDVRVLAASHVDLQQAVAGGLFRADLYYRLNVLPLQVPPLRARKEDVDTLAGQIFHLHAADKAARLQGFSSQALQALQAHHWPGNVRELINRVRRAMVLAEGHLITPRDLGLDSADAGPAAPPAPAALDNSRACAERAAIAAGLAQSGGNVSQAARRLGVSRMTLYRLLAKHQLRP